MNSLLSNSWRAAGATHIGRRQSNQDAFVVNSELGLYVVADGMGGYAGGEIASRLAAESVTKFVSRTLRGDNVTWPRQVDLAASPSENLVSIATWVADRAIVDRRTGELAQMGSTISMMIVRDETAVLGHIGDSRIYRLRRGKLERLTSDHTLYAQLVAEGHDMPPAAEYPYSNVITRALGASPLADVETVAVERGDRFILCSDGLSGPLSDQEIANIAEPEPPSRAAHLLVDAAYRAGGSDNITVVVVDYVGS